MNKANEIYQSDLEKAKELYAKNYVLTIKREFLSFSNSEIQKISKKHTRYFII